MTRKLPVTPNDQKTSSNWRVTGSCLVIGSYWKFSGDWELLKVVLSLGVTGSCLVIGSYWKFSGQWELHVVVWSIGVTGSFLARQLPVTPNDQKTSSNSP
jgi:hypothetical protein